MGKTPKYQQVADRLTRLIDEGAFGPGAAAPSVRKLSQQWKVSITTILKAYYLLEAQGGCWFRGRDRDFMSATGCPALHPNRHFPIRNRTPAPLVCVN
jgi:DNA-binding transcriptional MocR family regulator